MSASRPMPIDAAPNMPTQSDSFSFPAQGSANAPESLAKQSARDAGVLTSPTVGEQSNPFGSRSGPLLGLDTLRQANALYWKLNAQILSQERGHRGVVALRSRVQVQIHGRLHAVVVDDARARCAPIDEVT